MTPEEEKKKKYDEFAEAIRRKFPRNQRSKKMREKLKNLDKVDERSLADKINFGGKKKDSF